MTILASTIELPISWITAGIAALPETGSYVADATVTAGAVGVYWNDTVTLATATEDLREALSAAAILVDTDTTIPASIAALNDIAVGDIRTELATELARIDANIDSRSVLTEADIIDALGTLLVVS